MPEIQTSVMMDKREAASVQEAIAAAIGDRSGVRRVTVDVPLDDKGYIIRIERDAAEPLVLVCNSGEEMLPSRIRAAVSSALEDH